MVLFVQAILCLSELVNVSHVIFKETKGGCPLLTWEAEDHGLCEVFLYVWFLQKDNTTRHVTIPVRNQSYQDCSVTMNSTALYHKTIVYINESGSQVRISENDINVNETIVYDVDLQTTTTTTPPPPPTTTLPPPTNTTTPTTTTTTKTPTTTTQKKQNITGQFHRQVNLTLCSLCFSQVRSTDTI